VGFWPTVQRNCNSQASLREEVDHRLIDSHAIGHYHAGQLDIVPGGQLPGMRMSGTQYLEVKGWFTASVLKV
jgi:hypothetical protein